MVQRRCDLLAQCPQQSFLGLPRTCLFEAGRRGMTVECDISLSLFLTLRLRAVDTGAGSGMPVHYEVGRSVLG